MAYMELSEGSSHKFYEVIVTGKRVKTRWGRIGTKGQTQTKTLKSPKAAAAEGVKKIESKLAKGYHGARKGSTAPKPVRRAKKAATKRKATSRSTTVKCTKKTFGGRYVLTKACRCWDREAGKYLTGAASQKCGPRALGFKPRR